MLRETTILKLILLTLFKTTNTHSILEAWRINTYLYRLDCTKIINSFSTTGDKIFSRLFGLMILKFMSKNITEKEEETLEYGNLNSK